MAQPMKLSFTQDVMETSVLKKEILGALRILADGRKFRYARAGAGGVGVGLLAMAPKAAALLTDQAASAARIGDRALTLIVGADVAENAFEDGYLQITDAEGKGHQYRILSNAAALAGAGAALTLAEPLKAALDATSRYSLIPSPWAGVAAIGVAENVPVGVSPCAAAAGRYFWLQTGGPCVCLSADASDVGTMMVPGATAGSLAGMKATLDVNQPVIALALACAGSAGLYKPFFLKID